MSGRGRRGGGRGAYYKALYGAGGRGRGGNRGRGADGVDGTLQTFPGHGTSSTASTLTKDWPQLQRDLESIDQQQYGAYKRLLGQYNHVQPAFTLSVDHVQGDAYAAPSRVRAIMSWSETGLSTNYLQSPVAKTALCDFVTRVAASMIRSKHLDRNIGSSNGGWSGPKGGAFNINAPGQEILPRTSVMISGDNTMEMRFTTSLPAAGRTILGQQAWQILGVNLVQLVKQSLLSANLDQPKLQDHVLCALQQDSLRQQLVDRGGIAFVANGSILPRASGAVAMPMDSSEAIKFQSPPDLEIELDLVPGATRVSGMCVPPGLMLLTGGGFHGKSTLLEAIEAGIYNHVPGDGRERVVTDPTAVKIRAEDGRRVSGVDISPFISDLPGGKDTKRFSTDDGSGSTSMASNIQEALEAGCKTLLIDEDSSATNLLVRDQRMQALIQHEPITPLVAQASALFRDYNVSCIVVIGGLGDWLTVAGGVIAMDSYVPRLITADARAVVERFPSRVWESETYGSIPNRKFHVDLSNFRAPFATSKKFINLRPHERNPVGDPSEAEPGIDLSALDQIAEVGQARMIAALLQRIATATRDQSLPISAILDTLGSAVGIDGCLPTSLGDGEMVAVRRFELFAALSRMRDGLTVN